MPRHCNSRLAPGTGMFLVAGTRAGALWRRTASGHWAWLGFCWVVASGAVVVEKQGGRFCFKIQCVESCYCTVLLLLWWWWRGKWDVHLSQIWNHSNHYWYDSTQMCCQENKLPTNHYLFSFKTESQGFISHRLKNRQPKNNCSRRKNSKSGRSQEPSFPAFCYFLLVLWLGDVHSLLEGAGGCCGSWLTRSNSLQKSR